MERFLSETPFAVVTAGTALAGLWLSNIVYDLKVPHYISRKIGHAAGGAAFLAAAIIFSSAWWPLILASLFGIALAAARSVRPQTFRGVGGSGRRENVFAEVWFAWVAVPVIAVGWLWLNRPLIALSALLFMAWGDCVTGLVRCQVYHRPVKGAFGSLAMLIVCLAVAWAFVTPLWIGIAGALVATIVEWSFGDVGLVKWADDNWAVPSISLATMLGLMATTGNL